MKRRSLFLAFALLFVGVVIAADSQTKPATAPGELVVTYYYMPG